MTHEGIRGFSYRLREAVAGLMPGMIRLDGTTVMGPEGVAVAGFQSRLASDPFGGGQLRQREIVVTIDKDRMPEADLPKQGARLEVRIGNDETTWRKFAVQSIEGRGAIQRSWVIRGHEAE